MRHMLWFVPVVAMSAASVSQGAVTPVAVSPEEALQWTRRLVPLPKKITITEKVAVARGRVGIVPPQDAPALVGQAVKELRERLGSPGDASEAMFTLRLQMDGPETAPLRALPNCDQAYVILPMPRQDGLILAAIGPRGLYYAAKTVQQALVTETAAEEVRIPLLSVTDWPDMADRGLWGGDSYDHLRWMSDRKMNYDEQISRCGIDEQKRCFVTLAGNKQKILDEGPTYGINPVPVVLHLEQLSNSGLFTAYPELQGKDARRGAICYSNPLFVDILSQWLLLWRARPGVREVDVWMAENLAGEKGCQCESCRKEDRSVLEARAIVAAWKKALEKEPDLGLRVLTSEETEKSNPKVFEQLPPTVKIWYYHSLFTYNSSRAPMIRPYLVDAIRKGRWLGVCPNVCAIVGYWVPFTGPQFIHQRMNEFVDKKLSGLLGYAVPRISYCAFNTEAAAEWSWNAKGRSPREFAVSWAVRQGIRNPEKFADWTEANGPVAWDIYGSEYPSGERRKVPGKAAEMLKEDKLPELGSVLWDVYRYPWGEIRNAEQLDGDVAQAQRAVELARELGEPTFIQESLVVQGFIKTLKALWQLKALVRSGRVAEADRAAAGRYFRMYVDGLTQAGTALTAWETSLPMRSAHEHLTKEPVKLLEEMANEMKSLAAELGCEVQ